MNQKIEVGRLLEQVANGKTVALSAIDVDGPTGALVSSETLAKIADGQNLRRSSVGEGYVLSLRVEDVLQISLTPGEVKRLVQDARNALAC